jgi:O-antigen/teichoic acid export membrane protein
MNEASRADTFSGRVVVLFGTQVFGAAVGIVNGILLARLLGPAGKGDYYILIILPATTMVLIQLGLPQAFGFFAARGQTVGIVTKAMVLTVVLSLGAFVGLIALMPFIRSAFLHEIPLPLILFAFLALPLALNATFTTGIVTGRQAVRWYAAVNMAYPIATTALLIVILGEISATVTAAIAIYLIASLIQTIGFAIGAWRVTAAGRETAQRVSYRELFRYGLPFFPGSLTQFFSARADVYLIAYLIPEPSAPLGYYSMAVGLAELVFFFPNAVATLYFPHVAGSLREDSDRQVAMVSRVALLITAAVAVALVPVSVLMIRILLPAYEPALPALFVLLPGVVALSTTKIVYGYVTGIRMPAITSYVNIFAFIINIIGNLILIPLFGIVGAAAASLISYTISSLVFTTIAARLADARVLDFWIPRLSDIRFIIAVTIGLIRRVLRGPLLGH